MAYKQVTRLLDSYQYALHPRLMGTHDLRVFHVTAYTGVIVQVKVRRCSGYYVRPQGQTSLPRFRLLLCGGNITGSV